MMTRRSRATDSPTYDPTVERGPSPWNALDTTTQRIVAISGAALVILGILKWAIGTVQLEARTAKLEVEAVDTKQLARDNLAVTCILTRKVDPTIEPKECRGR